MKTLFDHDITLEEAKKLLDDGADVNARDENQSTPLHFASFNRRLDLVKLFYGSGADVNAKANLGITPLCLAPGPNGDQAINDFLKRNGAENEFVSVQEEYVGTTKTNTDETPDEEGSDIKYYNTDEFITDSFIEALKIRDKFILVTALFIGVMSIVCFIFSNANNLQWILKLSIAENSLLIAILIISYQISAEYFDARHSVVSGDATEFQDGIYRFMNWIHIMRCIDYFCIFLTCISLITFTLYFLIS